MARFFLPALIWLALGAASASAFDLTKIERSLAKEPAYQSKQPQYCLLVFGPAAKSRVWLVRDGNVLYVDRSGRGDLTDMAKAVTGVPSGDWSWFEVGGLTEADGKTALGSLEVAFAGPSALLRLRVRGGRPVSVDSIPDGALQFAGRPQDAPIIHFNGPLTFALAGPESLARNDKDGSIAVLLGTPGLGRGTFSYVKYDDKLIPNNARPVARIEFPSKVASGEPIHAQVKFRRRH
jgi:hypothetical protein